MQLVDFANGSGSGIVLVDFSGAGSGAIYDGYLNNGVFYKTRTGSAGSYVYSDPYTGEDGALYADIADSYALYHWNGTAYTQASVAADGRMARDFGKYASTDNVTLSVGVSGKYVDKDSASEVSNSAYAISNAISLAAGDILLVPSASAVLAACSVVSRKVTRTYAKVINYTYVTDSSTGRYVSATADYDSSLVYTAVYDSEGNLTWTLGGTTYSSLPATHDVTESFYEPLVKQTVAAMPDTGYYVYLSDIAQSVVISGLTTTVNGGICIKAGWGIFKNIASNALMHSAAAVIAQAISMNTLEIERIKAAGDTFGKAEGVSVNTSDDYYTNGRKRVIYGHGVPSATTIPDQSGIPFFVGQQYINLDVAVNGLYYAAGTSGISDWHNA